VEALRQAEGAHHRRKAHLRMHGTCFVEQQEREHGAPVVQLVS